MQSKVKTDRILRGAIWGIVISFTLLFITALLIKDESISYRHVDAVLIGISVVSGLVCGIFSKGRGGEKSPLNAIIAALVYSLFVLFPFVIKGALGIAMLRIIATTVAASLIGNILPLVKSNKKFHKKRKY